MISWYITIWYLYLEFKSSQSSILNLNVCVGFPYYSLPFGVTSAEVYFQRQLGVPPPQCTHGIWLVISRDSSSSGVLNLWIIFKILPAAGSLGLVKPSLMYSNIALPSGFSHSARQAIEKKLLFIVSCLSFRCLRPVDKPFMDAWLSARAPASEWVKVWSKIQQLLRGFLSRLPTSSFQQRVTGSSSVGRGTSNYSLNIQLHLLNIPNSTWILWL